MNGRLILLWVLAQLGCSTVVQAQAIPTGYRQVALEYELPAALLYAVALTESGHSTFSEGRFRPWPWTLNINGEGHYFASRHSAWRALQAALAETGLSVDIGLMQISWRYHHAALGSTWQALDPYYNLRAAAGILRDCYAAHTSWTQSVGCYHAPNDPAKAQVYAQRVQQHWVQLADAPYEIRFERP